MPIYEYKCTACGEHVEFIQRADDAPKTDCTECNAEGTLQKQISSPAIQFKGEGWYLTDYSDKEKKKRASAKKDAPASEAASSTETAKSPDTATSSDTAKSPDTAKSET